MRVELAVTSLMLDPENPRIEIQSNHRESLRELFRSDTAKMLQLTEDIATLGRISPLEKVGVYPAPAHKNRYIVGEGNRRIAALLTLDNPDLLSGAISRAVLARLRIWSRDYRAKGVVETVECELLSKEELLEWIARRHARGENRGRSLVPWGPIEQRRFLERTGAKKSIEMQFLDRYSDLTRGDPKEGDIARNLRISTFKRLLDSPKVRERFGVNIREDGWGESDYPPEEMFKWMRKVFHDITTGVITSRKLNSTKQMVEYIDSFARHELPDPESALRQPIPVEPVEKAQPPKPSKKEVKGAKPKSWSVRDLRLAPAHSRLRDIVRELELIPLAKAPNVHGVMMRVLVELATDEYLARVKTKVPADKGGDEATLKARINAAATRLAKDGKLTSRELTAVQKMTSNLRFYSTQTLNQFVHNEALHPSPSDVEAMWKNLGPYLAAMQKA